ncbi:MAG: RNA polymerase sigma factor [Bacteroidales bacterium]|nr:RNA polymerase sigma factor [Bacteroidales bacterium]
MNTEKKIIKGCLRQHKADQYRLYAMYSKKMFGICLRYSGSYEEAQDILQDGFVKVFKYLHTFKGKSGLEAWIRKIFINTAIEKYRERVYHLPIDLLPENGDFRSQSNTPDMLHVKDILAFVQNLPAQYRLVFNLYALEGYSHKEIGETLNISESTSRSNLARARSLLKEKLNKEAELILKVV